MGPNGEKCGECYFWQMNPDKSDEVLGPCMAKSPRPVIMEAGKTYQVVWPMMDYNGWCGEWKAEEQQ